MATNYSIDKLRKLKIHRQTKGITINLSFKGTADKLQKAQTALDAQVWIDIKKYMPLDTGFLQSQTNVLNSIACGSGKVYLYDPSVPYANYLYNGILYVDKITHKACFPIYDQYGVYQGLRSRKGKGTKMPSNRKLTFSQPNASANWGQVAIDRHYKDWVKLVQKALNIP